MRGIHHQPYGERDAGDHQQRLDQLRAITDCQPRADTGAEIVQATVLAGDIVTADVLATAIVSGGRDALDRATREFPVGVLAVFRDGSLAANPAFTARVGPR